MSQRVWDIFCGFYFLPSRLSVAAAYRLTKIKAAREEIAEIPSISAFRNELKKLPISENKRYNR